MIVNVKYAVGDIVYFPIYSKADLIKATVSSVSPNPAGSSYRISFTKDYIESTLVASESELMSFSEGKQALLTWLQNKIQHVNSMVEV